MALFMTLLVRNEEDILEANLRYHLEKGVDHIIVTDNLSTDATPDIIQPYVAEGVATYLHEADDTYAQSVWVTRMSAMAHDRGAEWIIHSDADEFWITPDSGSLADWFARLCGPNIVSAKRHDFICIENGNAPFWQRMVYRKITSTNPLGNPLPPKIAHRAAPNLTVAQGNHAVSGFETPKQIAADLEILHFPLRSDAQYRRKIELGGRAYARNVDLPESTGTTWRKQYDELQTTGRLQYIEDNTATPIAAQELLAAGDAVLDTRLAEFFGAGRGRPTATSRLHQRI